jgi:prepilin-type N-terminal cleavage/methylation domain-containing protein
MLYKLKKTKAERKDPGFTIIEVMIVLAIAGLILLIVFLAVPALQRSSRNTQRKEDVGRIGSAATTVLSNNNNTMADLTTASLQNEVGNLSYYTAADVTVAAGVAGPVNGTTTNTVVVYTDAVCGAMAAGGGQGATTTGAQNTSLAVVYSTETGGATADKNCVAE